MGRVPPAPGPRARVLLIAAGLFAAIFAARLLSGEVTNGITFLYVLPVVLVGVELGHRAGAAAGALALALFAVWTLVDDPGLGLVAYLSRAFAFVGVGVVTGQISERMREALRAAETTAKHFEVARDLLCTIGFDGYIKSLNDSWEATLGWSRDELMARPFMEFVHPDDKAETERTAADVAQGEVTASLTSRYSTKLGGWRSIEWTAMADIDERVIYAAGRDVTERINADHARKQAEERFRRAFEDSATGMALMGAEDSVILAANRSLARILRIPHTELVGKVSLSELADPSDAAAVNRGLKRLEQGDAPLYRGEIRVVRSDGRRVWVDMTASIVRDEEGNPLYRLSQILDIDARRRAEEQLRHMADHDPLSGVYNRRRFEQDLQRELGYSSMKRSRGAVLLLDVDRFKDINDTLGHAAGDAVIARIGATLIERLRSVDTIGRLGGDEFAVLLRRVDPQAAHEVARSVRDLTIAKLADVAGAGAGSITLSVGVAAFGDGYTPSMDELLHTADAAMYEAKRAGGNRVAVAP
jgi:diguanylate cyclase (GGDEF)-like protein/PAS domain S-box-containing protein